jgi:hypothetical protein
VTWQSWVGYAPPFGSARCHKFAGHDYFNVDGFSEQVKWHQIDELGRAGYCIVDVRNKGERRGFILEVSIFRCLI